MNVEGNKQPLPRTTVFIHSVRLLGNIRVLSAHKIGYRVQMKEFHFPNELGNKIVTHFDDTSFVVIEDQFPQIFSFQLFFTNKNASIYSQTHEIIIEDQHFNIIQSFQITFENLAISAVVTLYIRTKISNRINLYGYEMLYPSLDECRKISNNVYILNDDYVIKRIRSKNFNLPSDDAMREILPFYDMDPHDCLIKLKGYAYIDDELHLVLENGGESLETYRLNHFTYEAVLLIIFYVSCGLIHMHRYNYIHRDVKLSNIVVSKDDHARLIDFGISRPISQDDLTEEIGTNEYIAPEVMRGKYDFRADIYSLGVVILKMLSYTSVSNFIEGENLKNIPRTTQIIIRSMLSPDPSKRPTLEEIICLIMKKVLFFITGECDFDAESYKEKESMDIDTYNELISECYTFTGCPNYFNEMLMNDDSFFFHYSFYLLQYDKDENCSDILRVGHFLGDKHCSYMLDFLMLHKMIIALDVSKKYMDMRQQFLSLASNNVKTYLVWNPNQIKEENQKQFNRIGAFNMSCSLAKFFKDFEEGFIIFNRRLKKNKIEMIRKEIMSLLDYLSENLRLWNIQEVNFYYLIILLFQLKFENRYLSYFGNLINDEYIRKKVDAMINNERFSFDNEYMLNTKLKTHPDLADMFYLMDFNFKYSYLSRATNENNFDLREYYIWNHYVNCNDVDLFIYLFDGADQSKIDVYSRIIKSKQEWSVVIEFDRVDKLINAGKFKEAKELIKEIVSRSNEKQEILLFFLALIKFGEGDIQNGLINLEWAINRSGSTKYLDNLLIGTLYFHGYHINEDKEKYREKGMDLIMKSAIENDDAKYEIAKLYIQGIYVDQDFELALKYLPDKVSEYPNGHEYLDEIKAGYYFLQPISDSYLTALIFELFFSDGFVSKYDGSWRFGVLNQDLYFYIDCANMENPLAMYCLAHLVVSVKDAIFALETSLNYEFIYSFNELAYLYFV